MPPEVIFILVLIVFSILEGALRKKKPPGMGLPPEAPPRPRRPLPEAPERTAPRGGERETAEQMVPEDLWEEIAALARGDVEETLRRRRERARQVPEPPRPVPTTSGRVELPREEATAHVPTPEPVRMPEREPVPVQERQPRPIQVRDRTPRSREGRSREVPAGRTRPHEPAKPESRGILRAPPPAPKPVDDEEALRRARKHARAHHGLRGAHSLRHALIAREVLGRPLALREYGEEDFWSG